MKFNVLITKKGDEVSELKNFCGENNMQLICNSFIDFEIVKAEIPKNYDWIFFGSKRAAYYFLQQAEIPKNCKVACIGAKSKLHLEKMGIAVDFFGHESGNPESVANELKNQIKTNFLLVPISNVSNHSIAAVFPKKQVSEVVVYNTKNKTRKIIEKLDFIIFTSPSNVNCFLIDNVISDYCKIIAWGKTTENHLISKGFKVNYTLNTASENELIEILKVI
jgi:uroporphyrinogen-III synthase